MSALKRSADDIKSSNGEYNPPGFGNFGFYMLQKKQKLKEQDASTAQDTSGRPKQGIFTGLRIHINGYTQNVGQQQLKLMILENGGEYDHYLSKTHTTHIVASNLTDTKIKEFREYKVVRPQWILDSVSAGKCLPWREYRLISLVTASQRTLSGTTSTQTSEPPRTPHLCPPQLAQSPLPTPPPQPQFLPSAAQQSPFKVPLPPSPSVQPQQPNLDDKWVQQNTSMAPDFVEKFYAQSRLHHLSTWKQELRTIMQPIRAQLATKRRLPPNSKRPRVIMHVDMDCFFASVALRDRPHLQDQPVGISHATGHGGVEAASATADVASCNYVARKFGVRNGMSLGKARARCPELIVLPYEFDKYRAVSEQFYAALVGFADDIQSVSCDEAYLDVTSFVHAPGDEVKHAEAIRAAIVAATRCVASVGVSSNMLLARMATTKAKPNGSFLLRSEDAQTVLDACAVGDLPGVGWVLRERLQKKSVTTCQDLRGLSKAALMAEVGEKTGEMLYNYCRGRDDRKLNEAVKARQSVSTEISWGIRFQSQEQLETFMRGLSDEIHRRLVQADSRTRHITVKVMQRKVEVNKYYKHLGHGPCDNHSKSTALATATDAIDVIYRESLAMISSFNIPPSELRGIGIQCTKLVPATEADTQQRSLFEFAKPAPVTPRPEAREEAAPSPDIARTRPRPPPVHDDGGSSRLNVHDGDTVEEEEATAVNTQQSDVFDVDVYKQLPDDIQQELASQYRRAKGKHKNTVAVPAVIDKIQTQSHIAYEVLNALPPSLQAEITEEYNLTSPNKADTELPLQPPVPEEEEELVLGTPLLPRVPNARLPTGTTLTQMWDQRQRSKTVLAPWESSLDFERIYTHLDSEVLDALPEEIRAEVLREQRMFVLPTRANKAWRGASTGRVSRLRHHSNHGGVGRTGPAKVVSTTTTTRIQPAATVPAPAAAHGPTSIPPQGIVPAASTGEPCLLGKSSLADVRSLLTEWIIAHQDSDAPLDEDLVMVLEYVRQLVAAKNLEMTELVVQWIDLEVRRRQRRKRMTADDGWMQAVETVRDVAAQEVKRAYKAKLSIDI